jgi:hypothetical protein
MPKKKDLLSKLTRKPSPANFTTRELDLLMSKCGCKKLYPYQIKRIIAFLEGVGEIEREENNGTDGV